MSKYEKQLESANDDLREAVSISLSNNNTLSVANEHLRNKIIELIQYNDTIVESNVSINRLNHTFAEKVYRLEKDYSDLLRDYKSFRSNKYINDNS